jgi:hypothetical protein
MKSYLSALILFLIVVSCQNPKEEVLKSFLIKLDDSQPGKLSENFLSIEYILLDAAEEQPLVNPYTIKFSMDNAFVQDFSTNQLFVFDAKGQVVNIYQPKGKGPGEFFQIQDFHTDQAGHIFLHDPINSKIQTYEPNGELKEEAKANLRSGNFYEQENFTLFFMSYRTDEGNFNFIKRNKINGTTIGYVEIPEKKANSTPHMSHIGFVEDHFRDELYYLLHNSTEVVIFDKKTGDLKRDVHFDFGNYQIPAEIWGQNPKTINQLVEENLYVKDIGAFIPYSKGYFMYINQGGKKKHHIFLDENLQVRSINHNHSNDLDGLKINAMPWTFSQDEIVYLKRSTDIYNSYLEAYPEASNQNPNSNIHEFFNQNQEKLKEDMWVLVKLKLKNP